MISKELVAEARHLVSQDRLWNDLEALCRWERLTGTEGEREAVRYIQKHLEAEGISVTLHTFDAYISLPQKAALEVLEPENQAIPCITHSFGMSTPASGVSGEAVLVDRQGHPAGSLAGKVALIDGMVSPDRFHRLERLGAIAQVYVNIGDIIHELTVSPIWGTPTPENVGSLPHTPVVTITRNQGGPLINALKAGKHLRLQLRTEVDTRWRPVEMPEAVVRAEGQTSGPDDEREFVLVSAHLDSWYVGAMDNATGDVVLMELARVIHRLRAKLRRDLHLVFWIGHSHGRYAGSAWYADRFWNALKERCVGHLNVDQVGFRDGNVFRLLATADMAAWVHTSIRNESGQDVPPQPPGRNSDQSFWGIGVPSFSFRGALHPDSKDIAPHRPSNGLPWYWHHPKDTLDKIDAKLLADHTAVHAAAVADLLSRPLLPLEPAELGRNILSDLEGLTDSTAHAFDLGAAKEAIRRFVSVATALQDRLAAVGHLDASTIQQANRALRRISQKLICVLFTAGGPYHQDPAISQSLLPGLQAVSHLGETEEPGFLLARLVRERNRLMDALRDAEDIAEGALSLLA
jgi:hypothetical protein